MPLSRSGCGSRQSLLSGAMVRTSARHPVHRENASFGSDTTIHMTVHREWKRPLREPGMDAISLAGHAGAPTQTRALFPSGKPTSTPTLLDGSRQALRTGDAPGLAYCLETGQHPVSRAEARRAWCAPGERRSDREPGRDNPATSRAAGSDGIRRRRPTTPTRSFH